MPEKITIAAHLHVLLRRKTGRVTDTEWMVINPAYLQEVMHLAREKLAECNHDALGLLAGRLQQARACADKPLRKPQVQRVSEAAKEHNARALAVGARIRRGPAFGESPMGSGGPQRRNAARYIKGLR